MKKILLFLLVCVFGITLFSCESHSHELAESWKNDSVNHWHTCIGCDELFDVTLHSYTEWDVVQEATESAIGIEKHVCTVCGYEETREIPKLSHTHNHTLKSDSTYHWKECGCGDIVEKATHTGGIATETEKAKCEVCGTPYGDFKVPDHVHNPVGEWKYDGNYHWKECSCGTPDEKVAHTGGTATCTEKAKCEICDIEYGTLLNHNYTELKHDLTNHWYECRCGAIDPNSSETHSGGTATCTEKAKCEICDIEYGILLNHDYTELKHDLTNHWYECSCGEIKLDSSEVHKGGEATDIEKAKCEICGTPYGELNPSYHKHDYEMNFDSEYHWSVCDCGDENAILTPGI